MSPGKQKRKTQDMEFKQTKINKCINQKCLQKLLIVQNYFQLMSLKYLQCYKFYEREKKNVDAPMSNEKRERTFQKLHRL